MYDHPRSGCPPKLNFFEKKTLKALIEKTPHSPKVLLSKLFETIGKSIQSFHIKKDSKKNGFSWKRIQKSLRSKRDETKFQEAKKEIEELEKERELGAIDLFYFDESAFSLDPVVPYACQVICQQIEIHASRSKRLNVLAFLSTDHQFHSFF